MATQSAGWARRAGAVAVAALLLVGCAGPAPAPNSPGPSPTTAMTRPGTIDLSAWTVTEVGSGFGVPRQWVEVDAARALVVDQRGIVSVVEGDALRAEPMLDVRDRVLQPTARALEVGLAGFALAPDFATSGTFYTFTTEAPAEGDAPGTRRADTITR